MRHTFLKKMVTFMFIAMGLTVILIFAMMTALAQNNVKEEANIVLKNAAISIEANEKELENIKNELNEENLSKAKIVRKIMEENPEIENNYDSLVELQEILQCDEINIFDENGIITKGTIKDYYGFDAASGDQSRPFLEGLTDKNFEFVQEAQPNVVTGDLFQYIGVARKDRTGVIQIGIVPEKLQNKLENNKLENILKSYTIGKSGSILVINKSDNKIEYFKDTNYIGKDVKELGIEDSFINTYKAKQFIRVNGKSEMCVPMEYSNYLLCAVIPKNDVYEGRISQILVIAVCIGVIFLGLSLLIIKVLNTDVIKGINEIIEKLTLIKDGNLDLSVDVNYNDEFKILSNGINEMVTSIKNKINESKELFNQSEMLSKNQKTIIDNVKISAKDIIDVSEEVLNISKGIREGANEQNNSVNQLSETIQGIYNNVMESCKLSTDAQNMAVSVYNEIQIGNDKIKEVVKAMNLINTVSEKIIDIINNLEELANQSNLLALNASIEASRAGEQGRSFAVIAKEMAELAISSKQSAENTNKLIHDTIDAIGTGNNTVDETVNVLEAVMNKVDDVADIMNKAAAEIRKQEGFIDIIKEEMTTISQVVDKNSHNAEMSEITSEKLAEQANKLHIIIE